ncbi:DUF2785 domain-containing protein [Virgibacillus sp. C22-A2]|uniref:DUF2785 domain-containing protein n=1 Tax=Virgibacillus tibetensis TaxID=3042313 RepID=A0ABU6KJH1_9BACI|nr:DUF2785 domain-containing protein [Virgibacillus sp. C22-A2]
MNTYKLRETLLSLREGDLELSSVDISKLTNAMLDNIGHVDPVLRDKLIYSSFSKMIINNYYTDAQLKHYLDICLDSDHLFYKVGEVNKDSVFKRSFSSLIIAVILHVNLKKTFLTPEDLVKISDLLVLYIEQEQDVRGLVSEKGWAHSIAHIADALVELVRQEDFPLDKMGDIFLSIYNKMCFSEDYFQFEENERMVIPVDALLERGLNAAEICERIGQTGKDLREKFPIDSLPLLIYRSNIKQFLSSLYFHLESTNKYSTIANRIKKTMKEINEPYYTSN